MNKGIMITIVAAVIGVSASAQADSQALCDNIAPGTRWDGYSCNKRITPSHKIRGPLTKSGIIYRHVPESSTSAKSSSYCKEVASVGGTYSYTTEKGCLEMEAEARDKLRRMSIPRTINQYCNEVAGVGGSYSYSTMKGCVDMELKSKRALGR